MLERCKTQGLTDRQLEVLDLLRKGLTNAEICRALEISENTVKVHLANIYKNLGVSNRTEAASAISEIEMNSKVSNDVCLVIGHNEDIKKYPFAHGLFHSIVDNLHSFRLFQIKICQMDNMDQECAYQLKFTATQDENQAPFVSLFQGDNQAMVWSLRQKIEKAEQIKLCADRISIMLYRHMVLSSAKKQEVNPDTPLDWWHAAAYAMVNSENRTRESFEKSNLLLNALSTEGEKKCFADSCLASLYYLGLSENWVDGEEYVAKIGKLACDSMRSAPSSIYSMYTMALYNILISKKNEAIVYFEGILKINPLNVMVRRLLIQLYMLIGRNQDAMTQLDEFAKLVPDNMDQPFQFVSKASILFLQGKYEQCEQISTQVLMFHPEIPFARLLVIACNSKKGNLDEVKKHVKIFFEYHPNFTRKDLDRFIGGTSSSLKEVFLEATQNIFD